MTSAVLGMLTRLQKRRDEQHSTCVVMLENAKRSGRTQTTDAEKAALRCLRGLDEQIAQYRDEHDQMGDAAAFSARIGTNTTREKTTVNTNSVYRRDSKTSYLRDLVRVSLPGYDDTGESHRRLAEHSDEVRTLSEYAEYRDLDRIDGTGGYAVPPAWLMNQFVELARPGRAFANLCQRQPLPGGTDSINIPKVLTGTTSAIQVADNTQVAEQI